MSFLRVENLSKTYQLRKAFGGRSKEQVHAVDNVSFEVQKGETLGIVGESGCGKSTLGRTIVRLEEPTSGRIFFDEEELTSKSQSQLRVVRKKIQMIFQDPYASLNPRRPIGKIVEEPMRVHGIGGEDRRESALSLLAKVGLDKDAYEKYPHQFSGGQRQRVVIARALSLNPSLVVADEPVSALDVSIQAQVLNLFKDLQQELGLTYLFIAHDLGVVRHVSDRIAVMYLGKIVEMADAQSLYLQPAHPYTKALLSANPRMDSADTQERIVLKGDIPNPINRPTGCSFHPRCPMAQEKCRSEEPQLLQISSGAQVACHFAS